MATKQLDTRDLTGVEILAEGTWNGDLYDSAALDHIASAFDALKGKVDPPGKLGHDKGQALAQKDGYSAIGWVTKVYRQGRKLLADFTKVPGKVADLIQAGAYDKVSSEIRFDATIDGTSYPRVLTAVAFLGGDLPAVKDIKSISDVADLYADLGTKHYAEYKDVDPNVGGGVDRDKIPAEDFAGPDRSFPIVTAGDVSDAADSLGRAKGDTAAIKAKIIAIAKRKGFESSLPDAWTNEKKNSQLRDWHQYDWGDDLPATTIGAALQSCIEQAIHSKLYGWTNLSVVSDEEEDAVSAAWEAVEDTFLAACPAEVLSRPIPGKLASGFYADKKGDPADDDVSGDGMADEALAELDGYMAKLETRISGMRGAKLIRTFLGASRKTLAAMKLNSNKPRDPFHGTEDDMDIKKLAEALKLPETATEEEVLKAIAQAQTPKEAALSEKEARELRDRVVTMERNEADRVAKEAVDGAITAGKFVPAQREGLVKYALSDPTGFKELSEKTPKMAILSEHVMKDEKGNVIGYAMGSEGEPPADKELTAQEVEIARQMGTPIQSLQRSKSGRSSAELADEYRHARETAKV